MTGNIRGSGHPPAGQADKRPGPATTIAARAEPAALDQPFDGDSLYSVRAAVAAHASEAGIAENRVRDVVLAVHELAANAVRHGAGQGRVRLWATSDGIRCEVTDPGPPHAQADGDRPGTSVPDAAPWPVEHGHGLWLVQKVADLASVESGASGTIATVSFRSGTARMTS
jgi:anti-sigma regulatory factor (Ser/Thr protein kinase)